MPISCKFADDSKFWFYAIAHALEPKETWGYVWEAIHNDDDFASSLLLITASHLDYEMRNLQIDLGTDELHKLTQRIYELFPPNHGLEWKSEDTTPRQSLATYRMKVVDTLTAKPEPAAESALIALAKQFPDSCDEFMRRRLSNLRLRRRAKWFPPLPEELLAMIVHSENRYVTTETDLFNVTLESLGRFQEKLSQSELPAVERLWNWDKVDNKKAKHRPKDEESFSDEIASWLISDLKERGVVIGREVQIERSMKTDVLVKTCKRCDTTNHMDELTVVIEVKGCWNSEVRTGTEEQLVKKYLLQHSWTHGIYLVGWFCCPEWEWHKPNNKLKSQSLEDAKEEVEQYAKQAIAQHPELKIAGVVADCRYK